METKFNLTDTKVTSDGYVLKTGLIFRAGEYKDKDFSMTPEEILEAEASFEECPIDVEHVNNLGILDGKLGTLKSVYASEDGEELYGTAKIPFWLNELNKDSDGNEQPFRVSSTIDRKDKKIKKLAIVKNPRVSDAALMAAFTKDSIEKNGESDNVVNSVNAFFSWMVDNNKQEEFKDYTWDGKSVMQSVHDRTAAAGAICSKPPKDKEATMAVAEESKAEFVSSEESKAIQKLHDLAVTSGGKCYFMDSKWAKYSMDDKSSEKTKNIGRKKMTIKDIKAWFQSSDDQLIEELDAKFSNVDPEKEALRKEIAELKAKAAMVATPTEPKVEEKADFKKDEEVVDVEKEQLKKQVADLLKRNQRVDAEMTADSLVRENKIVPASKDAVVALFMQAEDDDTTTQAIEVVFSEEKTCKTRTELLKEFFNSLEAHTLNKEELTTKAKVLNFSNKAADVELGSVDEAKEMAMAYAKRRNKVSDAK